KTGVIVDAASGVSGAGRGLKPTTTFTAVDENFTAYGLLNHRHTPEMEQELSKAAGESITVSFNPHLLPMNRGILATMYVTLAEGTTANDLRDTLVRRYDDEPFVRVTEEGIGPSTRDVRGSNQCLLGVFEDRLPGRAIVIGAIDNLVKGSSGQAVQNMNIMLGFPEFLSLEQEPLFP
ncbi:MAG TPA: N-acetyl-gamma-glutamyl-phosphate reductase, partial [Sneathiellales bacterium]|nr:N-acetyl-gamma-glutamyl-phosphate reductase [Sneathiellales bacterium]